MSMLHHVPAVATTWMNHGRKYTKRVERLENALRICVGVIEESVTLFPVGVYPKKLPDALNLSNAILGELYTSCGSCDSFIECVIESGKILNSDNQCYIDELRGTPACKDYRNHSVIHLVKEAKMPVIKEIGFYAESEKVGYVAWIETIDGTYFVDVDGKITKPEM